MSKYADYNYLEIYDKEILGNQTLEEQIESLRRSGKRYKYVCKTIISGDYVECEIYPVYEKRTDKPKRDKEKVSKVSQNNLNEKNAKKQFVRLVNTNFTKDDLLITLSYEDKYLPTAKQAKRDVTNYLRRIKRYRDNNNLPQLKYIYVIESVEEEEQHLSKKIRVHHHVIINQMDRDVAEDLWKRGRVNTKRLQPDEYGLEGLSRYMLKQPKETKRYYASRNLKKPIVHRAITKLSKRKAEQLAKSPNMSEQFEKIYKGKYIYNDCTPYYSDIVGGFYLYCRMRKRI